MYRSIRYREYGVDKRFVYNSIFGGMYLWASIIILFIYFSEKSKIYLNFFLVLLFSSLLTLFSEYDYDILTSSRKIVFILALLIILILLFIFWINVIRNLTDSKNISPKLDKWLRRTTIWLFPGYLILLIIVILFNTLVGNLEGFQHLSLTNKNFFDFTKFYFIAYVVFLFVYLIISLLRNTKFNYILFLPIGLFLFLFLLHLIELLIAGDDYYSVKYDWITNIILCLAAFSITHQLFERYNFQKSNLLVRENEAKSLALENELILKEASIRKNEELEIMVSKRTADLNATLNNLKTTQTKLLQSEKLAHLGQLTAGVAHEIQNPLNFINNFSEINRELSEELIGEVSANNLAEVSTLAESIKSNSDKISYHGKRADSIVKSMLQHSRSGAGSFSTIDINNLLDEAWRLCYHGFRAKNKLFNVSVNFDLDMAIGKINLNPEEISRVFINLINNSLYATHEHWKQRMHDPEYLPSLELITSELESGIQVKIRDNGTGIPEHIQADIFNPFFTTKPTGEGVGLGLSLVFDIITKGHGGTIDFESKEGIGTTFTIILPTS